MTEYKSKVKYEAPIEINIEEDFPDYGSMAVSEIENMICSAVLKVGITVDKEELIKALRYDRGQYEKGYADGKRDAADEIEALQAEKKKTVTQIYGGAEMSVELKRCPFCGGKAEHFRDVCFVGETGQHVGEIKHFVWCLECPALVSGDTEDEAIEAWNRRAET